MMGCNFQETNFKDKAAFFGMEIKSENSFSVDWCIDIHKAYLIVQKV